MSEEAWDLINKLLTIDPEQRLGANGAAEVKAHPFFNGVNWGTLLEQEAVFIPKVKNDSDTSYFDGSFFLFFFYVIFFDLFFEFSVKFLKNNGILHFSNFLRIFSKRI